MYAAVWVVAALGWLLVARAVWLAVTWAVGCAIDVVDPAPPLSADDDMYDLFE